MKLFKPKELLIIVSLIIAVIIGIGSWWYVAEIAEKPQQDSNAITLSENKNLVSYTAAANKTALAQLKEVNDSVVTAESDFGEYVDSINGLKGGTDGKYWIFYVDGEMAAVGAAEYTSKGGEFIEWRFQN